MSDFESRVAVNQAPAGRPASARPARLRAVPAPHPDAPTADSDLPTDAGLTDAAATDRPADGGHPDGGPAGRGAVDVWDRRVARALSFMRNRLTGGYDVDEFGFDRELTEAVFLPLLRLLYQDWFRVEVIGTGNLPASGSALVVANHSGVLPLDALMLSVAVHDEHPAHRYLRLLGADLVFRIPVLSELARKHGSTLACNPDAERLLRAGDVVGVFPEGFKGVGKPFRDRYKLQRFGRGGFVSAALRTGTPIIPVSIVGAEETYPMLGNIKPLARLLGIPYFPVTPTFPWLGPLGLVPLPSKWLIQFGEPIETAGYADQADDPAVVFNLADQVRESIQQALHRLLAERDTRMGRNLEPEDPEKEQP